MWTCFLKRRSWVDAAVVLVICGLAAAQAFALILVGGSDPMTDPGWPFGVLKLANLPSRVSWWEGPPFGGGEYHLEYTCKGTDEFNEALQMFAAIQIPKLTRTVMSTTGEILAESQARLPLLVVHEGQGPQQRFSGTGNAGEKAGPIVWTTTVWVPANWYQLFNHPKSHWESSHPNFRQPVPVPQIDVYVGKGSSIDWDKVKVPQNVRVIDKRGKTASSQPAHGGVIRGEIYDMTSHRSIEDAEVVLEPVGDKSGSARALKAGGDEQGRFQVKDIPAGTFKVLISAGDRYAARQAGTYRNEGGTDYEAVVFLSPKAAITGTVKDADGKPIRGVKVTVSEVLGIDGLGYPLASEVSDSTDEDGLFELSGLPKGFVTIRCSAESMYQKASFELYDVPSDGITIVMTGTGTVRGKVIFKSGPPKGEIHVNIDPAGGSRVGSWGGSARCNPDGSFEFKGVPPGDYELSTTPSFLRKDDSGVEKITVKAGETVEVKLNHQEKSPRR